MLNDLVALVTPVSPALGKALTGSMASRALSLLGRAVLEDDDAGVDALTEALKSADPDTKLKIARAEADYMRVASDAGMQLISLGYQNAADERQTLVKLDTNAANDRASARQRQQMTNDRTNAYLAYIVTVAFILTIILTAVFPAGEAGNPALQTLLGILGTGWASMMAFFYGSSIGSREKTALLGEANTPPKTSNITAPAATENN